MPKIPISFKKTTRDMKLFTQVKAQEEQSEFVKNAIEHYIKHLENRQKIEKEKQGKME